MKDGKICKAAVVAAVALLALSSVVIAESVTSDFYCRVFYDAPVSIPVSGDIAVAPEGTSGFPFTNGRRSPL